MNDYLSHLVATTLNQEEVLQPRLPARFESFRQRLGPVDVPPADLAQPEAAPVSYDAGTASPVTFSEPPQHRSREMPARCSVDNSGAEGGQW